MTLAAALLNSLAYSQASHCQTCISRDSDFSPTRASDIFSQLFQRNTIRHIQRALSLCRAVGAALAATLGSCRSMPIFNRGRLLRLPRFAGE
jgi:hypothetical protein